MAFCNRLSILHLRARMVWHRPVIAPMHDTNCTVLRKEGAQDSERSLSTLPNGYAMLPYQEQQRAGVLFGNAEEAADRRSRVPQGRVALDHSTNPSLRQVDEWKLTQRCDSRLRCSDWLGVGAKLPRASRNRGVSYAVVAAYVGAPCTMEFSLSAVWKSAVPLRYLKHTACEETREVELIAFTSTLNSFHHRRPSARTAQGRLRSLGSGSTTTKLVELVVETATTGRGAIGGNEGEAFTSKGRGDSGEMRTRAAALYVYVLSSFPVCTIAYGVLPR